MNCARCGAPIIGGRWTIPTPRGLLCVCTACVEAPKVMRLFEKPQETWVYDARCQRCGDAFITNGVDVWCATCDPTP